LNKQFEKDNKDLKKKLKSMEESHRAKVQQVTEEGQTRSHELQRQLKILQLEYKSKVADYEARINKQQ